MKKQSEDKHCDLREFFLSQDQFGQAFKMRIESGKDTLYSKMGSLCSIMLKVILILFTIYKINILNGKKSIDIVQAVLENHFDDTHVFSHEQGLNIAVAVTNLLSPH